MPLRLVIENTDIEDFAPTPVRPSGQFIEAAIRAAKFSKHDARSAIIADVCEVLNCREDDLKFLFEHHLVPTQERPVIGLELPDYRMTLSEIYKEAAE